jgi:tetratricopeptide (TPR) repeat protein
MSGQYGMSFAAKLTEQGKYDEAVAEATRAIERDEEDPEPLVERAAALTLLERYAPAAADFERALALDAEADVIDIDVVDDAYFSALLGAARAEPSVDAGVAQLARYRAILPEGRHLRDADEWARRLRGELKSEFVKERAK